MADAPQSALQGVLRSGRGGASADGAGVAAQERRGLTIVQLAGLPGVSGWRAEVEAFLGLALPPPGKSAISGARSALWVGSDRWLIVEEGRTGLVAAMERIPAETLAVTDLSHARAVLRLSGPCVREVLAKGCAVDLHPRSAGAGACFVTALARHAAILHIVEAATVDAYVYRSFGQDLVDWLTVAAAEYGFQVIARAN
jgi:sarcosine oxidase subunit gamma